MPSFDPRLGADNRRARPARDRAAATATRVMVLFAAIALTGCAHYEYDIVSPPRVARHVGETTDTVVGIPPLEYRMRSVEDHLVIRVFNPTNDPIRLLGSQSAAVDPQGQSHPIRTQLIAPRSHVKLILPPMPPEGIVPGPSIGFGFGFGRPWGWGYGFGFDEPLYDPYWDAPRAYTVYEPGPYYWSWRGEGDARLELTFQRDEQKPFSQRFVFHRRRM